jgi:hypothetical protein
MKALFTPLDVNSNPITLSAKANSCQFTGFNWQQEVQKMPALGTIDSKTGLPVLASTLNPATPLNLPFLDPPPGGYTYQLISPVLNGMPNMAYPFYYDPNAPASYPLSLQFNLRPANCPPGACSVLKFFDKPRNPFLKPGEFMQFKTSLVGMAGAAPNATAVPLYSWTWTSNYNALTGGSRLIIPNSPETVDPIPGTGGLAITDINGTPQIPPALTCSASPSVLSPADGRAVPVTISGSFTPGTQTISTVVDPEAPRDSAQAFLNEGGYSYALSDEYGQLDKHGRFFPQDGGYRFVLSLNAVRRPADTNGRQYSIKVMARDVVGNLGSCTAVVTVP